MNCSNLLLIYLKLSILTIRNNMHQ